MPDAAVLFYDKTSFVHETGGESSFSKSESRLGMEDLFDLNYSG